MPSRESLAHAVATADKEQLSGEPAGMLGGQEHDDIGHVVRLADTS